MNKAAILTLTDDALLAQGAGRMVFRHPDRTDVVVKVPRKKPPKRGLFGKRRLYSRSGAFGPLWNSYVEIREFSRSVSAAGRVTPHYAQFKGFVQSDRGPGSMFEAVHNTDGTLAPSLKQHAERHRHEPGIEVAINDLWREIKDTWLIVSDPSLDNVVVTGDATKGYRLVIVDGVGHRVIFQVQTLFRRVHMTKCEKQATAMLEMYRKLSSASDPDLA